MESDSFCFDFGPKRPQTSPSGIHRHPPKSRAPKISIKLMLEAYEANWKMRDSGPQPRRWVFHVNDEAKERCSSKTPWRVPMLVPVKIM
ncbi:hypothetical protein RRF57_001473 [Xylaria bambusicola]|uniref:Uncharacterized protein n=1 Tax=Xylaria bambusicola TaxID=326684 RepID=A0AAN7Z0S8_9PEZI